MNSTCFYGTGIQRFRQRAAGYPPREFRGHTQRAARPVPAGLSRRQMTSPPGPLSVSPSGPRARSWRHDRACTAGAQLRLVPEQPLVAAVRHDMVDHRRGLDAALPPGTARTAGAAPGRRPGPGASADRSLGALRSVAAGPARASPPPRSCAPGGRCTGGFEGNGDSTKQNPPRPCRAGCRGTLFEGITRLHLVSHTVKRRMMSQVRTQICCRQGKPGVPRCSIKDRLCEPKADLGMQPHHGRV